MNDESKIMEHELVARAVKGHAGALAFLRAIARVLHVWDDLIDKDVKLADAAIDNAFWLALIDLPRSDFYREHFETLNTVLVTAIINWRIATGIERTDPQAREVGDLEIAFIIRSTYVDLLTMCALIVGGADWACAHGADIRRWAHSEGFSTYLENLAAEKAARKE